MVGGDVEDAGAVDEVAAEARLLVIESAAGGEGDDFEGIAGFDGEGGVFLAEESLVVEFDDEGFALEAEGLEEGGEGEGGLEGMGLAVELDGGHGGGSYPLSVIGYWGEEVRMASSQSFQTGSKLWSRRSWANSAGERVSSMENWGVAVWQAESFSAGSSSTRRPLMVRWRSLDPAPV